MQIILAFFSNKLISTIENIIQKHGLNNIITYTNLSSLKSNIQSFEDAIIISSCFLCGEPLYDFIDYYKNNIQFIIIDKRDNLSMCSKDILTLSIPLKPIDLISSINLGIYHLEELKKKRKQELISKAKSLLIKNLNITDEKAHKTIQKLSMDNRKSLEEIAKQIIKKYPY